MNTMPFQSQKEGRVESVVYVPGTGGMGGGVCAVNNAANAATSPAACQAAMPFCHTSAVGVSVPLRTICCNCWNECGPLAAWSIATCHSLSGNGGGAAGLGLFSTSAILLATAKPIPMSNALLEPPLPMPSPFGIAGIGQDYRPCPCWYAYRVLLPPHPAGKYFPPQSRLIECRNL